MQNRMQKKLNSSVFLIHYTKTKRATNGFITVVLALFVHSYSFLIWRRGESNPCPSISALRRLRS